MKLRYAIFSLALCACFLQAEAQYIILRGNGRTVNYNNPLKFASNDTMSSLTANGSYNNNLRLTNIKSITVQSMTDRFAKYTAPTYADYYISQASWSDRSKWNLANVHDPTVMRASDGYYYMYQTDASYGNAHDGNGHFFCRRSKNLVDWEFLGSTLSECPKWVLDSANALRTRMGVPTIAANDLAVGYWAPCVRQVSDTLYRMYYCIVIDNCFKTGSKTYDGSWGGPSYIGMMETNDPASNVWHDRGYVISSSSDKAMNAWARSSETDYNAWARWNAIDPSYIITPEGEHWLVYGSWHSGIAAIRLNAETGKCDAVSGKEPWLIGTGATTTYGKLIYTRQSGSRWQGSEGPEVIYRNGYYYLFLAYDELSVAYNTRVARSTKIDGPYYDIKGNQVTSGGTAYPILTHPYKFSGDNGWVGISHCAVFQDGNDHWFFASQQRLPAGAYDNAYANAIMLGGVRRIEWTADGWPMVMPERYGAVPQLEFTADSLVGDYEIILLQYNYQKQQTSRTFTLNANHTVSGTWNAGSQWSYNASTHVLTVNGEKLYVSRELDWEATPRRPTFVFAGYNYSGSAAITYWGKKK